MSIVRDNKQRSQLSRQLHALNELFDAAGIVSIRDERTPGTAAVIGVNGAQGAVRTVEETATAPSSVSPGKQDVVDTAAPPEPSPRMTTGRKKTDKKRSKLEKAARRSAALKSSGGYLEYVQYYDESKTQTLQSCNRNWILETKKDARRVRGIGCGERDLCPWCGEYVGLTLAGDALHDFELMLKGLARAGFIADAHARYGLKVICTQPKGNSDAIDKKLFDGDYAGWSADTAKLYEINRKIIREIVGPGAGNLQSMDYTGESNPVEAHYHVNNWIAPARYLGGEWVAVRHWFTPDELATFRARYTELLNDAFGTEYPTADIKIQYIEDKRDLTAWFQYIYKHQLHDLWTGWQKFQDGELTYKYQVKGEWFSVQINHEDLRRAFDRLALIPAKYKRVRWAGYLSDGQRKKYFEMLGLVKVEVNDDDESSGEKWVQVPGALRFVRFVPDGVILLGADDVEQFFRRDEIGWRPASVKVGRRIRWQEKAPDGVKMTITKAKRRWGFSWETDEKAQAALMDTAARFS